MIDAGNAAQVRDPCELMALTSRNDSLGDGFTDAEHQYNLIDGRSVHVHDR